MFLKSVMSVAAAAALVSAVNADTIQVTQNAYSYGSGGEFTVTTLTGYAGETGLPADLGDGTFETFCMELNETFTPGSVMSFVINTGSLGNGGFVPLTEQVAFLYTEFRYGTLDGFDFAPAGRQASAGALQDAIWYFQGQAGAPSGGSAADDFVQLANTAVAFGGSWYGMGIGDVRVLNNFNSDGAHQQDMLTLIPAPGVLALLGVSALVGRPRRRD